MEGSCNKNLDKPRAYNGVNSIKQNNMDTVGPAQELK